jgi:phosphoribosylaminoimidazole-succinocarboxamide synthase
LQVLNETSLWWFERTKHIVSNAVVSVPDKNVTIAKKCSVFPVEFVGELFSDTKSYIIFLFDV